ncbi:YlxR family protein [Deinococcus sp.]|uniref:YlxR family protein n=1 Tax=Deinococcus sp. TaxID=47478 RepID=UPI003B5B77DB
MTAPVSPIPTAPTQQKRARHVPERSCVACRRKRPQGQFVRLVRTDSGWVIAQKGQQGRGAYVCADTPGCWVAKRLGRLCGAQAAHLSSSLQAHHERTSSN